MTDTTDSPQSSLPDEALMGLVARRAPDAFAELVRRHQGGVVNFFRRMGDYSHAEDLTQETFIRLFRYREKYRPKAKFTTFLYLLARRAWVDHRRAADRRRRLYEKAAAETEVQRPAGTDAHLDTMDRLSVALDSLNEGMRWVVVMSFYQGLKYREIAEVLDIPLGTVKTRMFHALRKLKEALADDNVD